MCIYTHTEPCSLNLSLSLPLQPEPVKVAVKELQAPRSSIDCHVPELEEETKSWHVYHSGSVEARMMYQLNHPHILSLLGLTLYPIRLVLELAKEDLSSAISRYHKKNTRLSRRTLKATLIQVHYKINGLPCIL